MTVRDREKGRGRGESDRQTYRKRQRETDIATHREKYRDINSERESE